MKERMPTNLCARKQGQGSGQVPELPAPPPPPVLWVWASPKSCQLCPYHWRARCCFFVAFCLQYCAKRYAGSGAEIAAKEVATMPQ